MGFSTHRVGFRVYRPLGLIGLRVWVSGFRALRFRPWTLN